MCKNRKKASVSFVFTLNLDISSENGINVWNETPKGRIIFKKRDILVWSFSPSLWKASVNGLKF